MTDSCKTKTDLEMECVHLRRKLMEAEARSGRRLAHIAEVEAALSRRNEELAERGLLIKELSRRRKLSLRERRILDMWPRFEDGEPVWFGDGVAGALGNIAAVAIEFTADGANVKDGANGDWNASVSKNGRLRRPAPEVLDADGVPIRVGDTVWHYSGHASGAVTSIDAGSLMHTTRYVDEKGTEFRDAAMHLTHTRPDSWERLEEDANKDAVYYWGCEGLLCDACPAMIDGQTPNDWYGCGLCETAEKLDIVRRAKKLAGAGR